MIYDTLLIGCGFLAAGYATQNRNTYIIEEHQMCDSVFTLALPSFRFAPYVPRTEEGKRLREIFHSLSLFSDQEQNTSAFEFALSKYLIEAGIVPSLKCRVIETKEREDGTLAVTVQTNGGLHTVLARKIIHTRTRVTKKQMTVLFVSEEYARTKEMLLSLFPGAACEGAFYEGRYAIHIPIGDAYDENTAKIYIYNKWREKDLPAKILYIAPMFAGEVDGSVKTDFAFQNPIEAFEYGIAMAKEEG